MLGVYAALKETLRAKPRTWLVTGAAGFIGSNLVQALLSLGQTVRGLDNYATGSRANIRDVLEQLPAEARDRFVMIEGDIRRGEDCAAACAGAHCILHQAALGSVPRSIADPLATNSANVDGFIQLALAARDAHVRRMVYASSSSVYGDSEASPKREQDTGRPLSPYAVSKMVDEAYAHVFSMHYGLELIGLRYFNVFGRRQDPEGPYAAVIPKWIARMLQGQPCVIYGDGLTTRDFCYVENVVQANLLAATVDEPRALNRAYNVSFGQQTSLNELYRIICEGLTKRLGREFPAAPQYEAFRAGDVRASLADLGSIREALGYDPEFSLQAGMEQALDWYIQNLSQPEAKPRPKVFLRDE